MECLIVDVLIDDDWGDFGVDIVLSFVVFELFVDLEMFVCGDCDVLYFCGLFGWFLYDVVCEFELFFE